jgi:pilus assembly protein CpaE
MVVSLFGMRGGVGRTTLATNLAAALRHASQEEVCLIDLTPSGGQVALHLRLQARTSWTDLALNGLEWSRLEDRLLRHHSGLYVLAAPKQPQLPIAPSSELLIAVLEVLREHVSFAVLDLPPVLNPAVQTALSASDMVLHVITPEVISVQIALQTTLALDHFRIKVQHKSYILNQILAEPQLPASAVAFALALALDQKRGR